MLKMNDVLQAVTKTPNAKTVTVNPADAESLMRRMTFKAHISHCFEPTAPGINWDTDDSIERGQFRIE